MEKKRDFVAHGYHGYAGLCAVEVMLDEDSDRNSIVRYRINSGDGYIGKEHRSKIRYAKNGDPYYMEGKSRVYLHDVMRVEF